MMLSDWIKKVELDKQKAPTTSGKPQEPVSVNEVVDTSPVEKAGADVPTAPQTLEVTPLVVMCHYKNAEMTTMSVKTLLKTNPWVKKVLLVDTSEEQDAPVDLDKRVQIVPLKGAVHANGVQKALDWAKSKLYAGCKKGKDKWVLLLDSDVLFDHDVSGIIKKAQDDGNVLVGHEHPKRNNIYGMLVLPRIHPAFCLMNISWLLRNDIPFTDWKRIKPLNMAPLSNKPGDWDVKKVHDEGLDRLYDVGGTMYEDVLKKGGKIWNLGLIWEWNSDKEKKPETVYHIGCVSWAPNDEKVVWAKKKAEEICSVV